MTTLDNSFQILLRGRKSKCQPVGLKLAFQGNHLKGFLFFVFLLPENACEAFSKGGLRLPCSGHITRSLWGRREPRGEKSIYDSQFSDGDTEAGRAQECPKEGRARRPQSRLPFCGAGAAAYLQCDPRWVTVPLCKGDRGAAATPPLLSRRMW